MGAWGADKWIRYPDVQASQFGLQAPLWPAFVAFVLVATGAVTVLFWTAARRVDPDDRRPRGQPQSSSNTNTDNHVPKSPDRTADDE